MINNKVKAIAGLAALGSICVVDIASAAPQTFVGTVERNPRGGSVQVQITVENGKITAITTPVQPGGGNQWYSNYAIPTLTSRALTAQSANIQGVSGASQVATAWKASLASAISKAGNAITGGSGSPTTSAPVPVHTQATQSVPNSGSNVPGARAPRPSRGHEEGEGHESGEHEGFEHEDGEDDDGPVIVRPRTVITPRAVPTPTATTKSTTTLTLPTPAKSVAPANDLGLKPKTAVIQKTITCVKGTLKKTVKGTAPKCPTGYKLSK